MRKMRIDKTDPTDLYEQVAGEIRRAIADGEAKPGERLPPAKDLAAVLEVNTNTVLRALRLLRDEGLLEFRRGRGISVAVVARKPSSRMRRISCVSDSTHGSGSPRTLTARRAISSDVSNSSATTSSAPAAENAGISST